MADSQIDNVEIVISGEDKGSSKTIDEQIKKLEQLEEQARKTNAALNNSKGLSAWQNATQGLSPKGGSVSVGGGKSESVKPINDISQATEEASKATKEASKSAEKASDSWSKFSSKAKSSVPVFGNIKKHLAGLASKAWDFSKAIASNNSMVRGFRAMSDAIGGVGKKLAGAFSDIMRIVKYRMIRSAIKAITKGISEGMKNAYEYARLTGNQFAKSMDMIATSSLYAKNSLGALAMPIINTLAPAIDYLTDKFVSLLNFINEMIAALTGASTWTKAVKYPTAWGDAAEDAGGRAKKAADEYKNTILGIDEINPLNAVNDPNGGGSGGGGGSTQDYSSMFETMEVSNTMKDALANWGDTIAEKINQGIAKIKEAAEKLDISDKITTFTEQLNTMVEKIHWDELGKAIGTGFSNLVIDANAFVWTFNWENLGKALGDLVNKAIGELKTEEIGKLLAGVFNAAWSTSRAFAETLNFKALGEKIAAGINSFFENNNFDLKAEALATWLNGGFETLKNISLNVKWGDIVSKLADGFNKFIENFNWVENGGITGDFLFNLLDSIASFIDQVNWEGFFKGIGDFIDECGPQVLKGIAHIAKAMIKAIAEGIKGLGETDIGKIGLAIAGLRIVWSASGLSTWAKSLVTGLSGGINTTANAVSLSSGLSGLIVSALALVGINELIQKTIGDALREEGYLEEDDNSGGGWLNAMWDRFNEHVIGHPLTIKSTFTVDGDDGYFTPLMRMLGLDDPYSEGNSGGGASRSFDTSVNVSLLKKWTGSIKDWVDTYSGPDASKKVALAKKSWTSLKDYLDANSGGEVSKDVGLSNKLFGTVSDWINQANQKGTAAVSKDVSLSSQLFGTVSGWLNQANQKGNAKVEKEIGLSNKLFGTVTKWIKKKEQWGEGEPKKGIGIKKAWNSTVSKWLTSDSKRWGGEPKKGIGLKKAWDRTVSAWISGDDDRWGGALHKPIYLSRVRSGENKWDSVRKWIEEHHLGGHVTIPVELEDGGGGINITPRANGGTVASGQLFMARENGLPEMVGSFGGQNAVANNDQIVQGITAGVAAAQGEQNRLLREQNELLRGILSKGGGVTSSDVLRALNAANSRAGHAVVSIG